VVTPPQLSICSLVKTQELAQELADNLNGDRYRCFTFSESQPFFEYLECSKHDIDCLLLEATPDLAEITGHLHKTANLLPAILILPEPVSEPKDAIYHEAEIPLGIAQLPQIPRQVERAIARFLDLASASCRLPSPSLGGEPETSLVFQQQRLSEKLKERLGYLGIYYKRDPKLFFRHLSAAEQAEFLAEFRAEYRVILLDYFGKEGVNTQIDALVTHAFFADLSVSQVLEIHMELMDIFAKQLKLEGRNEDILLDYRLTLIDLIAHLCEMYRRSIPREV
jgi:circadian clock protein KaiA